MIALIGPSNILYQHAIYALHHSIPNSWFSQVRSLSVQYSLPDPLQTLVAPETKLKFKSQVKMSICRYWRSSLIKQSETLRSLCYMRLAFLPLGQGAHPMWQTCGSSPSAVRAATVQAKMISGRYRSCWLRRHWTQESGACRLPACGMVPGDVAHLLSGECPALQPVLATTLLHMKSLLEPHAHLLPPLQSALDRDRETATTFLLDPSTDPSVISLCQSYGRQSVLRPLFQVCRAWIWAAHRTRMRLLGLERYLL